MAQQNVKLRATELAASGTANRSRDMTVLKTLLKRALRVTGISPTRDQVCYLSSLWDENIHGKMVHMVRARQFLELHFS